MRRNVAAPELSAVPTYYRFGFGLVHGAQLRGDCKGGDPTVRVGSEAHKDLFCRSFIQSHRRFEAEQLPWPDLDPESLARVQRVPFWQEVLHTEMRAIDIIDAFTRTVPDPMIREAIDLMGYEEKRHGRLVQVLIDRYGIEVQAEAMQPLPHDVERTFIAFGYGECVDAFLGFGLFNIARQAKFLPDEMFDILDVLMYEETRHIILFTNWMAYREAQRGRRAASLRGMTAAWHYGRSIGSKVRVIVRNARDKGDGRRFSATQASVFLEGFSVRRLVDECLAENARRLGEYEADLVRPLLMPGIARGIRAVTEVGALARRAGRTAGLFRRP